MQCSVDVAQGGTCLLFGDEHKALVEMERLVREHIGCRVAHGSKYYRAEGHHQQSFNTQPIQVNFHLHPASIMKYA